MKLFEGSKLEPELEESEESKEEGAFEVVMYPNACNRRGRNSSAPVAVVPVNEDGMITMTPAKPRRRRPTSMPMAGSGEDDP